jgi:hypothetical protein
MKDSFVQQCLDMMKREDIKSEMKKIFAPVIDILILEGKKTLGDQVKAETLTFSSFIYTDSYFITPLDIWLLVQKYKIVTGGSYFDTPEQVNKKEETFY